MNGMTPALLILIPESYNRLFHFTKVYFISLFVTIRQTINCVLTGYDLPLTCHLVCTLCVH